MSSVTLSAPAMYADHHVLKAREALFALDGVEDVYASSAWQVVIVTYDAEQVDSSAIKEALSKAGYAPGEATPILAQSGEQFQDPAWVDLGVRVRQTNQKDLEMSGEFRRY